jgi:hypothetical protein
MGRKPQVNYEAVPLLIQMKRWAFVVLLSIVWDAFTTFLILGEDVFWKFTLVDQLYANAGTNPGDVFILVWVTGQMFILSFVILWNTGLLGYIWEWLNTNL